MEETCCICFEEFTEDEWDERHAATDGEDCHAHCCPQCQEAELGMKKELLARLKQKKAVAKEAAKNYKRKP